jgi:hypothetical protein
MKIWALGLLLAAAEPAAQPAQALPDWLHGAWAESGPDQRWADEYWTPARGDMMIGAARMGDGGRLLMFEHTRIIRDAAGNLVFVAQPRGAPPAEFPLVDSGAQMLEFANAAHDYPQRIRYWREGPVLRARTSLMDGSKAMEWRYRPMGSRPD